MLYHIAIRRICKGDWFWQIKGWLGETVETGHSKDKPAARRDATKAKNYLKRRTKKKSSPEKVARENKEKELRKKWFARKVTRREEE